MGAHLQLLLGEQEINVFISFLLINFMVLILLSGGLSEM